NFTSADKIDVIHHRGMEREDSLDAMAEADLAHCDGFAHATVIAGDHGAFKYLKTFFLAFTNLHVDANGIARPEGRQVRLEEPRPKLLNCRVNHGYFRGLPDDAGRQTVRADWLSPLLSISW